MRITLEVDGRIRFIYDDVTAEIAQEIGPLTIKRASHVEPSESDAYPGWWDADMSPVGGPVLGPYKSRESALRAEREWLEENRGL